SARASRGRQTANKETSHAQRSPAIPNSESARHPARSIRRQACAPADYTFAALTVRQSAEQLQSLESVLPASVLDRGLESRMQQNPHSQTQTSSACAQPRLLMAAQTRSSARYAKPTACSLPQFQSPRTAARRPQPLLKREATQYERHAAPTVG